MRLIAAVSAFILCLIVASCGLFKNDYQPYAYDPPATDGSETTGDDGGTGCPAGSQLTSFKTNIATPVNNTCSGAACHAVISKMLLTKNDDEGNRQKLAAYATDAATFISFLHSTSHQGGNMSGTLPAASINAWLAAEAKCK